MSEIQYLEINDVTRIIKVPTNLLLGVMEDKDVERVYFKCKKIVGDNVDLSKHQLYVKYVNALDNSGKNFDVKTPGIYHCEDVVDHGDYITFSWLLSGNVFKKGGFVAFSVLASDGETTRWNTFPAIGTVLITIPGGLQEVEERYPDIITQLLNRMDEVEAMATPEAMQGYVNTYLAEHPAEIDPELLDPKKCAPADVVVQLKEDISELGSDGTIPYKIKWEQGNVGGANPDIYTLDRVRSETGMYYPINGTIIGKAMDNHKILVFFYDENKTFIKNTGWHDEVVYSDFGNAKYVRFQVKKSDDSNIEPNEVEDKFSYSTVVREIKESVDILNNSNSKFNSDYYVAEKVKAVDGSVDGYFNAETITENDVYTKYDSLMNKYPSYVTKETLGFDVSDNYSIRAYHFIPPYVPILHGDTAQVLDDKPHYKKIILTSGTHGNGERGDNTESIIALYEFAKALCEKNSDNKYLYDITDNYHIIIVPLVNPWGVVNKSRYNARGVDINRNFTNGWSSEEEHCGEHALSENESKCIDALLSSNKDAIFCFDIHTRGGNTFQQTYPQIMGICTDGDDIEHLFQASIGKVKSKFDGFSGDLYRHGVFGCIRSQCRYYNIHSATIECTFMAENNGQKHTALSNKVNIEMLINSIIECIKKYS